MASRDEFEFPRARQEAFPTLQVYCASRTDEQLAALIWDDTYQRNVFSTYPGTIGDHARTIVEAIKQAALTPSEDKDVVPTHVAGVVEKAREAIRQRVQNHWATEGCTKELVEEIASSKTEWQALDALVAQITSLSAKVAAVEGERDSWKQSASDNLDEWQARAEAAEARADRLERQNRQMVEALAPFARAANEFDCFTHDPESMFIWAINGGDPKLPPPRVSVGDLRRARAALTETEGKADADHPGKQKLDELVAGLDGVTPGPWRGQFDRGWNAGIIHSSTGVMFDVVRSKHCEANTAHIARCVPDTIRSISDAFKALEMKNERLREIISKCATALGNGAHIDPGCTVEFMGELPLEIELRIAALKGFSRHEG